MKTKPNELAFPGSEVMNVNGNFTPIFHSGMTLRQYFIGQALAGLCANPVMNNEDQTFRDLAEQAIRQTDAVLDLLKDEE